MGDMATAGEAGLAAEGARLARAGAAKDGSAFAALYERYERRAFNLAYRITGSEADAAEAVEEAFLSVMGDLPRLDDRESGFGLRLFAATRNACHDSMDRRPHTQSGGTSPEETSDPGGVPAPGEEIREANMRLPARQREALALRDLGELSYDEIAAITGMNRNTVAQLISRARINLLDELRGTPLASIAAPSPECERAMPLIAMRDDEQLGAASRDAAWLAAHLGDCERCRLAVDAMRDADAAYRAWAPIAAPAWLSPVPSAPPHGEPSRRRVVTLAAGLAALMAFAGLAAVLAGDDPPATPADTASGPNAGAVKRGAKPAPAGKPKRGATKKRAQLRAIAVGTIPAFTQAPAASGAPSEPAPNPSPGNAAVEPTKQTSTRKAKPKPAPAPPAQPAFVPAPAPVEETPAGEPSRGKSDDKPPGHPSSNRRS